MTDHIGDANKMVQPNAAPGHTPEQDWTPEPWHDDKGYRIYGPITPGIDGPHHPERWLLCEFKHFDGQPGDSARAVACVNALAGIPDPAAFVKQAKEAAAAVQAERERCIAILEQEVPLCYKMIRMALCHRIESGETP